MSYLVCKSVCLFIYYLLVRSTTHDFNVIYIKSISLINISEIIIIETIFNLSKFVSCS